VATTCSSWRRYQTSANSESLAGRRAGCPLWPHTRSGGAPNYAPSLRSVAGLLGRSFDAAYEDTPPNFPMAGMTNRFALARRLSTPSSRSRAAARALARAALRAADRRGGGHPWRVVTARILPWVRTAARRARSEASAVQIVQGGEGVFGGAPAERARRLGAQARPNSGRSRTLPRRGHLHRPRAEIPFEARGSWRTLGENHKTEGPDVRVDNSLDRGCTFFDSRSSLPMVLID
jgi:hypothetical protein